MYVKESNSPIQCPVCFKPKVNAKPGRYKCSQCYSKFSVASDYKIFIIEESEYSSTLANISFRIFFVTTFFLITGEWLFNLGRLFTNINFLILCLTGSLGGFLQMKISWQRGIIKNWGSKFYREKNPALFNLIFVIYFLYVVLLISLGTAMAWDWAFVD